MNNVIMKKSHHFIIVKNQGKFERYWTINLEVIGKKQKYIL